MQNTQVKEKIRLYIGRVLFIVIVVGVISCNSNPTSPENPIYPTNVITSVNIGPNTHGIDVTPDGNLILIASDGLGNYLNFVDTHDYSVIAAIPIGSHPTYVEVSPDGEYAYCSNYGDASISVIDVQAQTLVTTILVGGIPDGLILSPSGDYLYVANYGNCTIDIISTGDHSIVDNIELRGSPRNIAVSSSGEHLYAISSSPYSFLYSIDLNTNTKLDSIELDYSGMNLLLTPSNDAIYALTSHDLEIVDTSDFSIESSYTLSPCGSGMTILQPGEYVYVCGPLLSGLESEVWVFDLADNTLAGSFEMSGSPKYMISSISGDRIFASCNALVVIGD